MTDSVLLVKLQPNQDITEALETVVRDHGFRTARILGSVGSFVEAVVHRDGEYVRVAPLGQEIAGLSGDIDAAGGSRLSGYVCRADTSVVPGFFARGLNAVGVTFELLLAGQT
jgi:predicted DNA-binding protein with PD1-like motif